MTQLSFTDALTGAARKAAGQARMEAVDHEFVTLLREQAKAMSVRDGSVTMDALRMWSVGQGLYPKHPNVWGCVLSRRYAGWEIIGYTRSVIETSHARMIAIWKWEGRR